MNVSHRTYELLHAAFDHFNDRLFAGELPDAMLVLHRHRGAKGYFMPEAWQTREQLGNYRSSLHEIALNPECMGRSAAEVLSTLAHEQAHLWQQEFGSPSKGGHHNAEWGRKMDEIGLEPTSTGEPGGKRTGRKVTHMIVPGGPFALACEDFLSQYPDAVMVFAKPKEAGERKKKRDRSKVKTTCPCCGANAWCREGMKIVCGECDEIMVQEAEDGDD